MDTSITAETVYTRRTTTREQWHAERRSRGLRAIEEQARMQYADFRREVYPLPMPTTCDLWWQHFNVRCGHTRHRLYLHLMERRTAERTRRLLSLLESRYQLPESPTVRNSALRSARVFLQWVARGETDEMLVHRVATSVGLFPVREAA